MTRRILITGASGLVGSRVVRRLLPAHQAGSLRLVAAVRNERQQARCAELGIAGVHLDFDDPASVRSAMQGIDGLFLATGYTVRMLVQSKTVLDAAQAAGVRHVVHLGALGEPDTRLPQYVWHSYVEAYIERLGMAWTHLQPKAFMQNVLAGLRPERRSLRHFFGDARLGWIDVDDIVKLAALALQAPEAHAGKAWPLAEEAMSMAQIAATIGEVTGFEYGVDARPAAEFPAVLQRMGMDPVYAAGLAEAAVELQASARLEATFDTMLAVTGDPGTRWRQFIERHRAAFTGG